jgi:hypothetical protein
MSIVGKTLSLSSFSEEFMFAVGKVAVSPGIQPIRVGQRRGRDTSELKDEERKIEQGVGSTSSPQSHHGFFLCFT